MNRPRQPQSRLRVPFKRAVAMIGAYAKAKLSEQLRAVAFVVLYLFAAQLLVFRAGIADALGVALGIGATVVGLAFFLEGLFLGIMPLGEHCGLKLPGKAGPVLISLFAVVLGVCATLAEPAIGFLKAQGSAALPWESPLLYYLLNRGSEYLVWAVAGGVGLAVLLGVFRFLYGWSFKPFVFALIPVMLALSFYLEGHDVLRSVTGLAWDTGGVTTGPVTVPLVIALGIGVSRISGGKKGGASSLGVVTLASALPVIAVFLLALAIAPSCPAPSSALRYFSSESVARGRALFVAGGLEELEAQADMALALGFIADADYRASFPVIAPVPDGDAPADADTIVARDAGAQAWASRHALSAVKAVVPLVAVLVAVLLFFLRERLRSPDELVLGVAFAILGMFLFSMGMERGLSALGRQAGTLLPRAYEETSREDRSVVVRGVLPDGTFEVATEGGPVRHIWIQGERGIEAVPFVPERYDETSGSYTHVPVESALFSFWGRYGGIAAVLAFVFILGFGATLAEPSLAALGATVEDMTIGTYRKSTLIRNVAFGVGFGMAAGFARILFDLPLSWILAIPYALALAASALATEEFSAIAWDSAGVTTGPITVPLVIAAGLGIGGGSASSFGVVAAASVFPVLAVLSSGLWVQARARRSVSLEALS